MHFKKSGFCLLIIFFATAHLVSAQFRSGTQWTSDGNGFYLQKEGSIVKVDIKSKTETPVVSKLQLTPAGGKALKPASFSFSNDNGKLLIFTNTAKVWRYNTKGDYWVLEIATNKLLQLGKGKPSQSLMYAKLSPNGDKAAYVSGHNLFVEDIANGTITQLTVERHAKIN